MSSKDVDAQSKIDPFDTFIDEIYSKPPKKNYITNKINIYHIDDTWSIDLLDLNDYGTKKQ